LNRIYFCSAKVAYFYLLIYKQTVLILAAPNSQARWFGSSFTPTRQLAGSEENQLNFTECNAVNNLHVKRILQYKLL